ncbi:MAG: nicotinate (nicotinamide) nucleotide adenylyltransferase [Planctomycetes bacterium]|nr:nicotinate (nicotinamide) nucleotide adenylyltransferase [Planctomycetota bacterium]
MDPDGLALLGGAFDPPHRTHRRIAEAALLQLPIAELRVVPAGDHPHKLAAGMAPGSHRLAMCQCAFAGLTGVVVDDREIRRAGRSFTVDTLQELRDANPQRPLFFVIGADNLPLLPTWRDHHRILRLCTVTTFPRADHPITPAILRSLDLAPQEQEQLLRNQLILPPDEVSATAIRAALRAGAKDLPELLPAVEHYLRQHHLYGT